MIWKNFFSFKGICRRAGFFLVEELTETPPSLPPQAPFLGRLSGKSFPGEVTPFREEGFFHQGKPQKKPNLLKGFSRFWVGFVFFVLADHLHSFAPAETASFSDRSSKQVVCRVAVARHRAAFSTPPGKAPSDRNRVFLKWVPRVPKTFGSCPPTLAPPSFEFDSLHERILPWHGCLVFPPDEP